MTIFLCYSRSIAPTNRCTASKSGLRSDVCTTIHLQPRCSSSYPPEKKPTFKKKCGKNY
ncbi:hypothetical protein GIB67_003127 [Kingdonia uniflora]|uniref:Uncharacterized protein n=1 Tax=Kingdonia uniflora TaxID=39325 RepID=A0A7J7N5U9_9MAGN|nr:hypothetical protein GIB67_003127 [Kingdonia uniflora]